MTLAAPLSRFWIKFSLAAVFAAFAYVLAILFWGINRGFDFADEGFYLLLAKHPHQYPLITYFNVWSSFIPAFTRSRVLDFRYAQIICQIAGSVWLSCAYFRALKNLGVVQDKLLIAGAAMLAVIGNILLFAKFPFSISYNSLTGILLFGATALIIDAAPLTKPFLLAAQAQSRKANWMIAIAGLLSGFCFSIKFPASLVFVFSGVPLIFLFAGRASLKPILSFLLGVIVSLILTCIFILDPAEWWNTTKFFMRFQAEHHGLHSSLVTTYLESIAEALSYFKSSLIPALVLAFASFFVLARQKGKVTFEKWHARAIALHMLLWLGLGVCVVQTDSLHHNNFSANIFYVFCLVLFCEIAGFHLGQSKDSQKHFSWRVLVLNLTVCLLPVICAAGTRNLLPFQCTIFLAPTFLLLYGLAITLNKQIESKIPAVATLVFCSVVALFQFYDGFVRHPYDLSSRLNTQTQAVQCKKLRGLRMVPEQAKFIEDTQKILQTNGMQEDDNVLAFYQLPGLVYAVGGVSPGLGWYSPLLIFREWNEHFVQITNVKDGKNLFVIADRELDKNLLNGMNQSGMKFPADFKLIGTTHNPCALGLVDGVADMKGKTDIYKFIGKPQKK